MRLADMKRAWKSLSLGILITLAVIGAALLAMAVTASHRLNAVPTANRQETRIEVTAAGQQPTLTTVSAAELSRADIHISAPSSQPSLPATNAATMAQADFGGNMPVREVVWVHDTEPRRPNFSHDAWIVVLTPNDAPAGPASSEHAGTYLLVVLDGQTGAFLAATEGS